MIKLLLGFLSGPLTAVSHDLKEAYQSRLNAANDAEKLKADERINLLEARKSVILASQPDLLWRVCRAGLALPFVLYINKLVIYDKVLGWGVTDALGQDLTYIMMMIIGGFFLETTVRKYK